MSENNKYTQKDTENWLQYAKRLIKKRNMGEYDIDKTEIYELLTGDSVSNDHARKMLCFLEKILNKVETDNINMSEGELLEELEIKRLEIHEERIKRQTVNLELNRTLRQKSRFDLIWENVSKSIEKIEAPQFNEVVNEDGDKIGIIGISDIHYSKEFKSFNNEYSIEICKNRLNKLIYEIKDWVQDRDIKELHILNAGDSVEGLLRCNQLRALEIGVIESTIEFSRLISEWLNEVSKQVKMTINYHHVPNANHTEIRFFNSKAGQFAHEDLEKIIINYVHDLLQNNKYVNVPIYDKEYIMFEVCGKNVVCCHGHQLKGKSNKHIIQDLQKLLKKQIDIVIVGHKHHEEVHTVDENEKGNIKFIMLPSIMGSDEYSDTLFTGSLAASTFIEFNRKKKGLSLTEVILN